jgi:O-antigen/teichoic acid export membrane protein
LIEAVGVGYIVTVIKTPVRLLVTPFYLERLGKELLGFSSFIRETTDYLKLVDLGIPTALAAVVAKDLQPGCTQGEHLMVVRMLRAGAQMQSLVALLGVVAVVAFSYWLEYFAKGIPPEFLIMAKIVAIAEGVCWAQRFFSGVYSAVLIGQQRIAQNIAYDTCSWAIATLVGVVLVYFGYSLYGLCIASLVSTFFFFFQVRRRARKLGVVLQAVRPPIEWSLMRSLLRLSGWVFLAMIGGMLSYQTSRFVLGITPTLGMEAVNQYSLLVAVPLAIRAQANAIVTMARPGLTQLAHAANEEDAQRAKKVGFLLLRVIGLYAGATFVIIWAANGPFVTRWVGGEHYAGDLANFLVAVLAAVTVWTFGFKALLMVRFQFRRRGVALFAAGLVSLVVAVSLVRSVGLPGVLIGVIAGEILVAAPLVIPPVLSWFADDMRSIRLLWSVVWVPLLMVGVGLVGWTAVDWQPSTWLTIGCSVLAIGGYCAAVGFWWIWRDIRPYIAAWQLGPKC